MAFRTLTAGSPPGPRPSPRRRRRPHPAPRRPRLDERRAAARRHRRGVRGLRAPRRRRPAAFSAAVGFNFFHTQPYLSLRISSSDDVETAVAPAGGGPDRGRDRAPREARAGDGRPGATRPASIQSLGAPRRRRRGPRLRPHGDRLGAHPPARPRRLPLRVGADRRRHPPGHPPGRLGALGTDGLGGRPMGAPHRRRRHPRVVPRAASWPLRPEGARRPSAVRTQLAKAVALVDQAGASLSVPTGAA